MDSLLVMQKKKKSTFWRRKILNPLQSFLSQGLSLRKLALSLALGATLGTFPILGLTTILCFLTAVLFKLNMPVIQFANYVVYPLQILMLVPFYRIGDIIFSTQPNLDFSAIRQILTSGTLSEMTSTFLMSTLYAVIVWLLISPVMLGLLYAGLKPVLIRLNFKSSRFRSYGRGL